jgi:cell division protein FtsL
MSLSDRDRELACKYAIGLDGSAISLVFTEHQLRAYLAERDQLAIKEKDDAVRAALEKAAQTVENLVSKTCGHEEVRIQNDAFKISAHEIRALIEPKE